MARVGILSAIAALIVSLAGCPSTTGPGDQDAARTADGGSADGGSADAGLDGGPCAPRPPATGTGCHVSSECDPTRFEQCFAPGASRGCGICIRAMHTCATDADCASSDVCVTYVDPCSVPYACGNDSDVTSSRCQPRCTPTSCGAGEACAFDGRCAAIPCAEGAYTCPAHTSCGGVGATDAHGCARDTCSIDADCGCGGACLEGACFDTLGRCEPPAA